MEQPLNPRRRQFLIFSGIAAGSLLLAPVLTKLNFLEETLRANVGPLDTKIDGSAYGSFPYGGVKA